MLIDHAAHALSYYQLKIEIFIRTDSRMMPKYINAESTHIFDDRTMKISEIIDNMMSSRSQYGVEELFLQMNLNKIQKLLLMI